MAESLLHAALHKLPSRIIPEGAQGVNSALFYLMEDRTMSKYIDAVGLKIKLGKRFSDDLRNAPSVVPKPKEGEWIRQGISPHEGIQICSVCGAMYDITAEFDNCPNCHAKMKGTEIK